MHRGAQSQRKTRWVCWDSYSVKKKKNTTTQPARLNTTPFCVVIWCCHFALSNHCSIFDCCWLCGCHHMTQKQYNGLVRFTRWLNPMTLLFMASAINSSRSGRCLFASIMPFRKWYTGLRHKQNRRWATWRGVALYRRQSYFALAFCSSCPSAAHHSVGKSGALLWRIGRLTREIFFI